jgi:predicted DCC family thiol-disulfide oxidoreductase YuxK
MEILFYDAQCPLCRREIALLQRLARPTLAFQDIHAARDEGLPSRETLLKTLHLQCESGVMTTGLAANIAAWQHTPFGVVWRVLLVPGIRAVAERAYNYWAWRRYARLYSCALGQSRG